MLSIIEVILINWLPSRFHFYEALILRDFLDWFDEDDSSHGCTLHCREYMKELDLKAGFAFGKDPMVSIGCAPNNIATVFVELVNEVN